MSKIKVRIPATTTNLGPGFDCLGLALSLYNTVELEITKGKHRIEVTGEGRTELEKPDYNLVLHAVEKVYEKIHQPCPPVYLRLTNQIPFARGLGSSAAAYLGGLTAANVLSGNKLSDDEILELAVEKEGHPDNVVPAMKGGFTVSSRTKSGTLWIKCQQFKIPPVLVAIPDMPMKTKESRTVLPSQISYIDAVQNIGRTALLVSALAEGKWDLLRLAMEDRLHQPYRDTKDKLFSKSIQVALNAGAYGAALSGSGSTILTFIPEGNYRVGQVIEKVFAEKGITLRLMQLDVDNQGLTLME